MWQMRMDNRRLLSPQPSMQPDPSPRIYQALTHPQIQNLNIRSREFRARFATVACKSDNSHAPSTLAQPAREQHHLPLRPAHSIKSGNDNDKFSQK
jgi:hypothetical protein